MARTDIDRVAEIYFDAYQANALKHGYARRIGSAQEARPWVWNMLRHGPSEIFVAEADNQVVGANCINPRGNHGGAGPLAIDPHFQGKGVAKELMHAIIGSAAGLESIRGLQEAYNPVSFSLTYALGFVPVEPVLELHLTGEYECQGGETAQVTEACAGDFEAICSYDNQRSKYDRRPDFNFFMKWGKILVHRHGSAIDGILACLPGRESVQLGPLVSEGEGEAADLYRQALAIYKRRSFLTCVMAKSGQLVNALLSIGFKLYCIDLLIVRGTWRPSRYVEAFGRFPEGI